MSFTALDVGIGLALVYLILSLMCTVVQEMIAGFLKVRSKGLRAQIQRMLDDPDMAGLAKRFYAHPRIRTLSEEGKLPSYIAASTFANVISELVSGDNLQAVVATGPLAPFIKAAGGEVEALKTDLSNWFDEAMKRTTGMYKRWAQWCLFFIGLALAVALNVQTPVVAKALWSEPSLRNSVASAAADFYKANPDVLKTTTSASTAQDAGKSDAGKSSAQKPALNLKTLQKDLNDLALPIGWTEDDVSRLTPPVWTKSKDKSKDKDKSKTTTATTTTTEKPTFATWLYSVGAALLGWLLTALACSLGAQFWFNTLGQALKLRAAGEQHSPAAQQSQT